MTNREAKLANLLLVKAMLLAASYTLMRSVGDTLFLARVGSESLAAVFVLSGIATACLASFWFALTRRLSLDSTLRIWGVISAGLTLTAWFALPAFDHSWWLLAAIYLLTEVKGAVNAMNIVSASNETLGRNASRRAWARFGLGAPLGVLLTGMVIGIEASFIDLRTWLLVSAGLDLLVLWPLSRTSAMALSNKDVPGSISITDSRWQQVLDRARHYADSRKFKLLIGLLITAKVVVLTLITFNWKVSVNDFFSGNEQSLTRYFGIFYACMGTLTLFVQLLVTGPLLARRKLHVPLLLMPVVLLVLSGLILTGSSALFVVAMLTIAKSTEVWRRSVHDTTVSLLYTRLQRSERRSAISINTALVKPAAEVGASLFLLWGPVSWLGGATVFWSVLWLLAAGALLRLLYSPASSSPPAVTRVAVTSQTTCSGPA